MADASYDVFISYKSEDLALAEAVNERLVAASFRVWFDKARLDPGCKWHEAIEAGCEASRIVLPILTPRWRESEWTRFEAYGHECLLGLWCAGEDLAALTPPPLQGMQHLDLRAPTEATWQALIEALRRLLSEPPPEKAPRVAHLPYAHNPYFVGRDELLLAIHEKLHQGPTVALTHAPAFVVAGMGGVGKTTLAREYAEKFWRLYRQILWVSAAKTTSLTLEFARLALEMGLLKQPTENAQEDAALALRALAADTPRLLIIDNAEDEEAVQAWVPQTGGCRTIITSRFTAWSPAVDCVPVHVLEREPARELLLGRGGLPATPENDSAADRLAETLGYLPLALEQAAAFIRETKVSLAEYLTLHEQSHAELLAQEALGSTQYPDSVATTWLLTVGKLTPLAQAVLRLSAFLAPSGIPRDLFADAGEVLAEAVAEISGAEAQPPTAFALLTALRDLARYSMIELEETAFGVHRLVQQVERDRFVQSDQRHWVEWTVTTVYKACPSVEFQNWGQCAPFMPHAVACAEHVEELGVVTEDTGRLLNAAGYYHKARAAYVDAERLYRQSVAIIREALGRDHPDFPASLVNLAELYREQGDYAAAEPLLLEALEIARLVPGGRHPHFAVCLNNLAMFYKTQGNYAAAGPLYEEAANVARTTFGEDHPLFAAGLHNLAAVHLAQGDYAVAEPLFRRALSIWRKALGDTHPNVAASLHNLGMLYAGSGDHTTAERFYWQALEIRRLALGEQHPYLAISLNDLAELYRAQGKYAEAEPMIRRALAIWRQSFGNRHPNTRSAMLTLAAVCEALGKHDEAAALRREAEA